MDRVIIEATEEPIRMCECDCMTLRHAREGVATRGVASTRRLWPNGSTLGVSFSGGSYGLRGVIGEIAEEWPVNLRFDWQRTWGEAEIRIECFGEGSWAYVGDIALSVDVGKPTMRLGWAQWAYDRRKWTDLRAIVLHEFGHAIGLKHEHLSPRVGIDWDLDALRAYYIDELDWSWTDVEALWLNRYDVGTVEATIYDERSVMHYPVDARFVVGDRGTPYNYVLSDGDVQIARTLYPQPVMRWLPIALGGKKADDS